MWIVLLEPGVWLADGEGDPPRTLRRESAQRFQSYQSAERALREAQRMRPFDRAVIEGSLYPG